MVASLLFVKASGLDGQVMLYSSVFFRILTDFPTKWSSSAIFTNYCTSHVLLQSHLASFLNIRGENVKFLKLTLVKLCGIKNLVFLRLCSSSRTDKLQNR